MKESLARRLFGLVAFAGAVLTPMASQAGDLEYSFDRTLGTEVHTAPSADDPLERQLVALATSSQGRIGVAAIDLGNGREVSVLGNQPFPMASTVKVAIMATFLSGVDRGLYRLDQQFPTMIPLPSKKFSSASAPVRPGTVMSAKRLIELAITRSDNTATDGILAAIGGPQAVNRWLQRTGNTGIHIDRTIATLVRDDGAVDPARTVDSHDSATPEAMVRLLAGLHRGEWLSPASTQVLLGAMERCKTSKHRFRAMLPEGTLVQDKTGTLFNTASDVGFIYTPDGRPLAIAIYVTGQGGKPNRSYKIASIARELYDGYASSGAYAANNASSGRVMLGARYNPAP